MRGRVLVLSSVHASDATDSKQSRCGYHATNLKFLLLSFSWQALGELRTTILKASIPRFRRVTILRFAIFFTELVTKASLHNHNVPLMTYSDDGNSLVSYRGSEGQYMFHRYIMSLTRVI